MVGRVPTVIQGHDSGAAFWIQPVKCHSDKNFDWDTVEECSEEEVSLDEGDVEGFLAFFFRKYFDDSLIYNRERMDDYTRKPMDAIFEWYLTHNFYTYDTMSNMLNEIEQYACLIEQEGIHCLPPALLKDWIGWFRFENDEKTDDDETIKQIAAENIMLVADYYKRFVGFIRTMMKRKPDWPLISVMGP